MYQAKEEDEYDDVDEDEIQVIQKSEIPFKYEIIYTSVHFYL